MDDHKKLMFVAHMTNMALMHVKKPEPQKLASGGPVTTQGGPVGAITNFAGVNNPFQATAVPITPGTTPEQLATAYGGVQGSLGQTQTLANTVAPLGAQGANTETGLTSTLQNEAAGRGPNPALAALNQETGQNIAAQGALAAGQRGASSNPGLVAREAARRGGDIQQNAVGQAATLQSEQELAAERELQGLAGTQIAQNQAGVGALNSAELGEQGILQGANATTNNANVSMQSNINNANAGVSEANQKAGNSFVGGLINGGGGFLSGLSGGGAPAGASSGIPSFSEMSGSAGGGAGNFADAAAVGAAYGGTIKSKIALPSHLLGVAKIYHPHYYSGGDIGTRLEAGGKVPGKPKMDHDDYSNDTVSAKLTPGESVIDLDTLKRKDKVGKAARFVASHLAKKNKGRF